MSTLALATRGLDKSFGSLGVARNVTLEVPRGERYALIGPNGAGKTTLLNLITGMLKTSLCSSLRSAYDGGWSEHFRSTPCSRISTPWRR